MPLRDPFAAYNASTNFEAHLIRGMLTDAGIESVVIEDTAQVAMGWAGPLAELHKPQGWIERTDIERARPILTDYDQRNAERRMAERDELDNGPAIEVVCDECGKQSTFPARQKGRVERCQHCRAYVDVGDDGAVGDWGEAPIENEE